MLKSFRSGVTKASTTLTIHAGFLLLVSAPLASAQVSTIDTSDIQLLSGSYYSQMHNLHEGSSGYLSFFQPDDLLYEFRKQAGLPQPASANDLGGFWEGDSNDFGFVRGHTAGHYLTAASRMYAQTGNTTYLNNVTDIVAGLAEVQTAFNDNGYLAALPQSVFTTLENDQMSFPTAWVPYYTQHKILAGLNDAHTFTGNQQALDVAFDNAQYFVDRVNGLPQYIVDRMVKTHENQGREFGGMNETLTDLYVKAVDAGDSRAQGFLDLANVFNNRTYMETLAAGIDALPGTNANTHIPQAVGWAKYGRVAGDATAVSAAQNYFDIVTRDHTFATGGNSFGEWYRTGGEETGTDGSLLAWNTAETCNVYNMIKLSGELFQIDQQTKYAAYAENALINQILPSIEPTEGVTTYFMSLKPGHFKTYHTGHVYDGSCWCCAGSGMENPTRYTDMTYFKNADAVYVNTFMPSQVEWEEKGITLTQQGDSTTADEVMQMTVNTNGPTDAEVKIRIPSWANGDVTVTINGQAYTGDVTRGEYLTLDRQWQDGDEIEVTVDKNLYIRRSRDDPSMVSVYYGAVLLAGELGTDGLPGDNQKAVGQGDYAGVSIPVSVPDIDATDADPSTWLVPVPGEDMHFELYDDGVATGIIFKPFYETHHERYSVYWKLDAPAGTRTWRGGGAFNTVQEPTNWDIAPEEGDSIIFDGDLTTNVDNSYVAGSAFNDITFASTAASFNIGGNRMTLQGNMSNTSSQVQTVKAGLTLSSGSHAFHSQSADLHISGDINGSGSLNKTGNGRLILSGNNSYAGTTTVSAGELQIGDGGTSGSLGSGDVTLANNASIAFNRSDNIGLHTGIQGDGNLIKRGTGTLTVNATQAYNGETRIEEGTLKLSDPLPIESEVFMLDFTTEVGTITDTDGQTIGFTRRLSGTDTTSDDPNLDLVTSGAGALYITSGGPSDINGETNLSSIEAPGINLSDLGLDQSDDFTIYATFEDAVAASNFRQYGIYVGGSAEQLIRGGYLSVNGHNIFGVNKSISSNNDSSLSMTSTGAPSTGDNVDIILSRTSGVYSMTVNGIDVTPTSQLTELKALSDLTLGVFAMHTSSGDDLTIPLSQFTITSPGLSAPPSEDLLPIDTDMLISAGATFDMNNASQTLRSLQGEAGSALVMGSGQTNVLTIVGDSGSTQFDGVISGQGNLVKAGTSELVLGGVSNFDGTIDLQAGTLALTSYASVTGLSNVDIQSGAILELELSHAGDLNMLGMSGNFAAGGTLRIVWAAGALTPQAGDSYDLFDFASLTGDFTTLDLPTLASGLAWNTSNLLTTGVISVEATNLAGDLDGDGFVGLSDLDIILTNWNTSKPDDHPADPSGDNYVGLDDLDIVLANWNAGTPPTDNANIPEPNTLLVLGLSGAFLFRRRH